MPLKVSPVCGLARLRRCGCGGGSGRARSMLGSTAVPAITDKKNRRSIDPFKDDFDPGARFQSVRAELVTEGHRRQQYISEISRIKTRQFQICEDLIMQRGTLKIFLKTARYNPI